MMFLPYSEKFLRGPIFVVFMVAWNPRKLNTQKLTLCRKGCGLYEHGKAWSLLLGNECLLRSFAHLLSL